VTFLNSRIAAAAVLVLTLAGPGSGVGRPQAETGRIETDLVEVSIAGLQALYESGTYTVTDVATWYLDRIERYDDVYRAFLDVDRDAVLGAALAADAARAAAGDDFQPGSLWGVPVAVKGNTSVQGRVTTAGWAGYQLPGYELVAPEDATIISRLREAGAIVIGLTNLPDFAASDTTISSAGGRTGNAYDWRFSPGGSSGGTATAVSANFATVGTGSDTSNSIRLPSGASSLVGVLPTRGLVSIAGIHPLDWLLDTAGPMARTVSDAALMLSVMAGEDPSDFRTAGSGNRAPQGPYTDYLDPAALEGKRFGVPAFILDPEDRGYDDGLWPETRAMFMRAVGELEAAGATVVIDEGILPEAFVSMTERINVVPYRRQGIEEFLAGFGPEAYHSTSEFQQATGLALPAFFTNGPIRSIETDPEAENDFFGPQRRALAVYMETLDEFELDGFVYPALQMPPNNELIPQPGGGASQGAHTRTGWTNTIGVPAVGVPAGYYPGGLPFGLEFSGRPWRDQDLLGWAYGYEQATRHRVPPDLTEQP